MLEAFRVGVVSRGRTLWEGLTFAAGDGQMWVVTGLPSCGKTLLMQILRGERRPDFGDVVLAGESLYRGSPEHNRRFRLSSGVVPESLLEETQRTVEDLFHVAALAMRRISAAERAARVKELLSIVGLSGAQDTAVSSLSCSERARVALAVELFRGPRYLFLDMLLAHAGPGWVDKLGALLRALAKEDRTIVMMERNLPEAWRGGKFLPPVSMGPFCFHRLDAAPRSRKEAAGSPRPAAPMPETAGGGE